MTSFKTPPPRPKPNKTITKVDFFHQDLFLKYEGSRIVFPKVFQTNSPTKAPSTSF